MQNRRHVEVDKTNDFDETLNETDTQTGKGLRINAQYHMQIWNTVKGKSLQREQQIRTD